MGGAGLRTLWLGGPWRGAALLAVSFAFLFLAVLVSPGMAAEALCPGPGSGAGQCSNPQGVATDFETERVYVAERGNHRISVFEADGDFLFAFGWGVNPITPGSGLETCTTASGCQQGISGAGAGQLSSPESIAVDNVEASAARHDVYVTDANRRVSHFKEDGSFVNAFGWGVDTGAEEAEVCTTASGCLAGIKGGGECQLSGSGDPIAIGPGGNVFVADTFGSGPSGIGRVQKFSPAGACLGETVLTEGNFGLRALEVDASEDAYVSVDGALRKYDLATAETQLCELDPELGAKPLQTNALAMDEAGQLFAAQRERGDNGSNLFQVVTEYDVSSCPPTKHVRRVGYGEIDTSVVVTGIAALHTADGDIFVNKGGANPINYLRFPPPGPIAPVASLEVIRRGSANADVRAEVNPEGKATSYHFEYVNEAQFEINGFTEAESTPSQPLSQAAGAFRVNGAEELLGCEAVTKAEIEAGNCLEPETTYRWRIVSSNADGPGLGTAEGPAFETKAPLEFEDLWASEVGPDSAILSAIVNPVGSPTTGFFEYVTDAQFKADVGGGGDGFAEAVKVPNPPGEAELNFGEGETGVKRTAILFPLAPGTTYHYRIAATNPLVEEFLGVEFLFSKAETFETFAPPDPKPCPANEAFRIGPSSLLPDCRAYEMVSPLDKANGDIVALPEFTSILPSVVNQSAASGERLTYGSYRPFGEVESAPITSQYIAARDPEVGWETHAINPPKGKTIAGRVDIELDNEYRAFSEDLCQGWITTFSEPQLAPEAIAGYRNLYQRTDQLCGAQGFEAVTTAKPQSLPLPQTKDPLLIFRVELQGHSADGSVTAFMANDSLQGSGAPLQPGDCGSKGNCKFRLYLKGEGTEAKPRYACIRPGGAAATDNCTAGTLNSPGLETGRSANVSGALSADGKRIFWTTWSSGVDGEIFLRENPLGAGGECSGPTAPCTVAVSKKGEEESGSSGSHFWAGAKDGSAALYTTGTILTGKDLYRYVTATKATEPIAGGVLGLVGASADAKRVYFASTEVLTGAEENEAGQKAEANKANLYFHEAGGSYRFIGQLAPSDLLTPGRFPTSPVAAEPVRHNGRVSPSGLHAAFMSAASLTGYDNTDAKSGKADTEVFLYDASANGGAGELVCASCNPTGGRPAGADLAGLDGKDFWVAARIPASYSILRAPEVLSPEGSRLFFESIDPLVARDTNGRVDVYQWERAGQGSCDEADAGFSEAAGGCVDLISTGQSLADSKIVDASASGADVFFTTVEGILPQDYGLQDIYDARIEGGFPPPPPAKPVCEGESCQNPPGAPEFPTGATATNVGPGNIAPKKPKSCPKGKHKVKKGGKSRCVANKKKGKGGKRAAKQRRSSR